MKYYPTKRALPVLAAALLLVVGAVTPAAADILHHKDGTNVRGKITYETPDLVRIETAYGVFSYSKDELSRIERRAPADTVPTPRVNYATVIPAGPVNPANPPQVAPLVKFARPATTATADAAAVPAAVMAIPTPVAPAVPVATSQALTTSSQ